MRQTLIVAWAACCLVSMIADLSALADHHKVWYLWVCLALDVITVPLCARLFHRAERR